MNDGLFSTYDIRGAIDTETAWNIGKALAEWLPTVGSVVVTKDRAAPAELGDALIEGLRLQGRDVVTVGDGTKETVVSQISVSGLSGGVYVAVDPLEKSLTIELFDEAGRPISHEHGLEEIQQLVEAGNFVPSRTKGTLTELKPPTV